MFKFLFPVILILPSTGGNDPHPEIAKVLRAFYPDGPGLAAKGLMINAKSQGEKSLDLIFLNPEGWIRLQSLGPHSSGAREVIGPRGAFLCKGRNAEPLAKNKQARLQLTREIFSLLALWPLLAKDSKVNHAAPLTITLGNGDTLTITLDNKGLPESLLRKRPNGDRLQLIIPSNTLRRNTGSGLWPSQVTAVTSTQGRLTLELTQVQGFQATSRPSFFGPPRSKTDNSTPVLPPGVKLGHLDFRNYKGRCAVWFDPPHQTPARDKELLKLKNRLNSMGLKVAGLPLFSRHKQRWISLLPLQSGNKPPAGMKHLNLKEGLHAVTFLQGDWNVEILDRAAWLERQAWHKGYKARGNVLIIPYHRPGEKISRKGTLLTELRLPVAPRDK